MIVVVWGGWVWWVWWSVEISSFDNIDWRTRLKVLYIYIWWCWTRFFAISYVYACHKQMPTNSVVDVVVPDYYGVEQHFAILSRGALCTSREKPRDIWCAPFYCRYSIAIVPCSREGWFFRFFHQCPLKVTTMSLSMEGHSDTTALFNSLYLAISNLASNLLHTSNLSSLPGSPYVVIPDVLL